MQDAGEKFVSSDVNKPLRGKPYLDIDRVIHQDEHPENPNRLKKRRAK